MYKRQKIGIAKTSSAKGNIHANILQHLKFVKTAIENKADAIFFPELSITGYEPTLAKALATDQADSRFDVFQQLADTHKIIIGVGVPTKTIDNQCISMVIFQPNREKLTYSKQYLHPDEFPFFENGGAFDAKIGNSVNIAIAICYELSISEHSANAHQNGANIYIASVAKTAKGVTKASEQLAAIAKKYSMPVLMSNSIGPNDDFISAGQSAVWDQQGVLIGQLNATDEGVLIYDMDSQQVTTIII